MIGSEWPTNGARLCERSPLLGSARLGTDSTLSPQSRRLPHKRGKRPACIQWHKSRVAQNINHIVGEKRGSSVHIRIVHRQDDSVRMHLGLCHENRVWHVVIVHPRSGLLIRPAPRLRIPSNDPLPAHTNQPCGPLPLGSCAADLAKNSPQDRLLARDEPPLIKE
jgi:hypothetical protein